MGGIPGYVHHLGYQEAMLGIYPPRIPGRLCWVYTPLGTREAMLGIHFLGTREAMLGIHHLGS